MKYFTQNFSKILFQVVLLIILLGFAGQTSGQLTPATAAEIPVELIEALQETGITALITIEEQAKFTASDGVDDDRFGYPIALDGNTALIGATGVDNASDSNVGAAYIFTYEDGSWTQQAKLTPTSQDDRDGFGYRVDLDGDTAVVSTSGQQRYVYVFEKPESGWVDATQDARLSQSDSGVFPNFLQVDVAVEGDVVMVGAPMSNSSRGAVYVYEKPAGGWSDSHVETTKIYISSFFTNTQFGYSLDLDGDTLIVGAYADSGVSSGTGVAYIFEKPAGGWGDASHDFSAKLMASDGQADDRFGWSVGVSGNTFIVGQNDSSGAGTVYVFEKPASGWPQLFVTQTAKLTASNSYDHTFANDVSIDGDLVLTNGYLFTKPAGGWVNATEDEKLVQSGSGALSGDTLLIGDVSDDNGKGAAYIYSIVVPTPPTGSFTSPTAGGSLGIPRAWLSVDASDADGIASVTFYAYYAGSWHQLATDANGTDGWGCLWSTAGLAEQTIQVRALVRDNLGNQIQVQLDNISLADSITFGDGYETRDDRGEIEAVDESLPAEPQISPPSLDEYLSMPH